MKVYLYRKDGDSITAENDGEVWTIWKNTKKIFGDGVIKEKMLDGLTRAQVDEIYEKIAQVVKRK